MKDGSPGYPLQMLPNLVITMYMLVYFIFFKSIIYRYSISVQRYLFYYIAFVFVLVVIFFNDPTKYFQLRSFWTMSGNVIQFSEFSSTFRFTGTLSDPNNIGSLICAVMAFLIFNTKINLLGKLVLLVLSFLAVIATMSTTGLVLFFMVALAFLVQQINLQGVSYSKALLKVGYLLVFSFFLVFLISYVAETEVGNISYDRSDGNSIDSRYEIWKKSFNLEKIVRSLVIGDGGLTIIDGKVINPHSGHLYLLYAYGFIFYLIFLYVFFVSSCKFLSFRQVFFIPIFICFTVNVGIYELRFSGLMALMIAAHKVYLIKK
jgi:hypothetical protein